MQTNPNPYNWWRVDGGGGVYFRKSKDLADKIQIKPSQIDLNSEITKTGTYDAKINLHADIIATIHIEVAKQEEKN